MSVKTWKIIDRGSVPLDARTVEFGCECGQEAQLPIVGTPLAQLHGGIVFDNDQTGVLPVTIQCRKCGRILTTAKAD
jgi:lysyl-tRNA synthetase class I